MRLINQLGNLPFNRGRPSNQALLRLAVFSGVVAVVTLAVVFRDAVDLEDIGYAGLGLTVLVASGGLVLPVPSLATACAAGSFLNPPYVALVAGSAGAIGELTGYFLGYSGRGIIDQSRLYIRMEGWMRRRGWLALFIVALIPNPIFDVVGIAAGALRYPIWRFLIFVWAGKLLKFLALAYACAYSIDWLTGVFGV